MSRHCHRRHLLHHRHLRLTSYTSLYSTFAEYTVVSEISCAKIDARADLGTVCLLGCGITTGLGAVRKTTAVEEGSSVGVFGLGAVGLAVVQAAKMAGAAKIYAIDTNAAKFGAAVDLGATDCVNPSELGDKPVQQHLVEEVAHMQASNLAATHHSPLTTHHRRSGGSTTRLTARGTPR